MANVYKEQNHQYLFFQFKFLIWQSIINTYLLLDLIEIVFEHIRGPFTNIV